MCSNNLEKLEGYQGCFACDKNNPIGLKLNLFLDKENNEIISDIELDKLYTGFFETIHGGVISTLLDEAMAWVAIKISREICVTKSIKVDFLMPIKPNEKYKLKAKILDKNENILITEAFILNDRKKVLAKGKAEFVILKGRRAAMLKEKLKGV